jgi:hypothetical protein
MDLWWEGLLLELLGLWLPGRIVYLRRALAELHNLLDFTEDGPKHAFLLLVLWSLFSRWWAICPFVKQMSIGINLSKSIAHRLVKLGVWLVKKL